MEKVAYTIDQFWDFPDDGNYHEIINGEHIVSKAPSAKHQAVSTNLLRQILAKLPKDFVFHAPTGLFLDDENAIIPDIMVIRKDDQKIVKKRGVYGVPEWIIEILSPTGQKKDMITLRDLFHLHEVPEYWVVDPELERLYVFLLNEDYEEQVIRLEKQDKTKSESFEITIDLKQLFNLPEFEDE